MKHFLIAFFATAVGNLIYTGFLSSTHEFDWFRASFVGVFCCMFSALWPKEKKKLQ